MQSQLTRHALIAIACLAGCGGRGSDDNAAKSGSQAATPAGSGASPLPAGAKLDGLKAKGPGPTLSWTPPPMKEWRPILYHVTTSDGWMWEGPWPSVVYHTVEEPTDQITAIGSTTPRQFTLPKPGTKIRWTVTMLDEKGEVEATSEISEFTYTPSAEPLPPRAKRHQTAVFDCDTLVPEALRTKFFAGYEFDVDSPCGDSPRPGCPWGCRLTKKTKEAGRLRTTIYYNCGQPNIFDTFPKDAAAKPVDGIGKGAHMVKKDSVELVFGDKDSNCVVKVTSDLAEADVIAVAQALEKILTPELVGIAP